MNAADVLTLLEDNQNPRGIANWDDGTVTSFGIGLTQLRKLAKQIGRDHELARQLWQTDNYEAKVLGLLLDEPGRVTREQAERQVEQLHHGMLSHVFASCDATLAKTPFVVELAEAWVASEDPVRRKCGYGLLYEISKDKRRSAPDDAFFERHIAQMAATWRREGTDVLLAIGSALMGIGKRNRALNAAALAVARDIGPIDHSPSCDPYDVVKHLTSESLLRKLGS